MPTGLNDFMDVGKGGATGARAPLVFSNYWAE